MKELQLEELERSLADLIKQREELGCQIKSLQRKIANKKAYDKHFREAVDHRSIRNGKTCQELFGKPRKYLTADEARTYQRLKQAERRARVKAERSKDERN